MHAKSSPIIVSILFGLLLSGAFCAQASPYRFEGQLTPSQKPYTIAVAPDGSVWLEAGQDLQHFNAEGIFIAQFPFKNLSDLTVTDDGSLWIKDGFYARKLNTDGQMIKSVFIGESESFTVAKDGSFWVLSTRYETSPGCGCSFVLTYSMHEIKHIDANGKQTINILGFGSENSFWKQPCRNGGIKLGDDGSLWATCGGGLSHLNTDGSVIAKLYGLYDASDYRIKAPGGIAPSADGSVWLADQVNNYLVHLAADGSLLAQLGSLGNGPGQFKAPQGVAVASDGSVWVADTGNNRIQKLTPKKLQNIPAEYDDQNNLLYIDDVTVAGTHYQATLQFQNDKYRLLTLLPTLDRYNPAASFDAATNLLSIPQVRAHGQDYQAQFQHLGNSVFQLQTATLK